MHSFGHAAYFGIGAYGAACWSIAARPMPLALVVAPLVAPAGALLFGWFAVRLSGVYLAMLTLAFAQIVWAIVFQWEDPDRRLKWRPRHLAAAPFDQRLGLLPADAVLAVIASCCCGDCCSRRSAPRCAPDAIRHCVRKRSASTSSACTGSPSRSRDDLRRGWRPLRLRQGLDLAGTIARWPLDRRPRHGAARRHSDPDRADGRRPGVSCCRTPSCARPSTGARCWAS